jgi:hypothetical protein
LTILWKLYVNKVVEKINKIKRRGKSTPSKVDPKIAKDTAPILIQILE